MLFRKFLSLLFFIVLLTTILFESCLKKGDDDPFISLKSRESRLKGKWDVTKYLISGEDKLNNEDINSGYYSYPCGSYSKNLKTLMIIEYDFDSDGEVKINTNQTSSTIYDYTNNYCTDNTQSCTGNITQSWKWAFLDKSGGKKNKERIVINTENEYNTYFYCNGYSGSYYNISNVPIVYNIIKLAKNEMVWETTMEDKFIELEFKKKE